MGQIWGAKSLPFTPVACPVCFPSLPQAWEARIDGVGNFAQTGTPRSSRAHNPRYCLQLGDRMENTTHCCQGVLSPLPGGLAMPS